MSQKLKHVWSTHQTSPQFETESLIIQQTATPFKNVTPSRPSSPVAPNLFSAVDPFGDLAESSGPLKPVDTVSYKWSLLENAIISFAR